MMLRKNTVFAGGFCVFRSQIGKTILRQCARCLLEHNLASILEREREKKTSNILVFKLLLRSMPQKLL